MEAGARRAWRGTARAFRTKGRARTILAEPTVPRTSGARRRRRGEGRRRTLRRGTGTAAIAIAEREAIVKRRRTGRAAKIAGHGRALAETLRRRARAKIKLLPARLPGETGLLLAEAGKGAGTLRSGGGEIATATKSPTGRKPLAPAKTAAAMFPHGSGGAGKFTPGARASRTLRRTELEA